MSPHKIYIFSQSVHSGKTTTLQQWLRNNHVNAAGILTPDKEGKRVIYDIATSDYHDFEVNENHPQEDTLEIGKFRFSKRAFETAKRILTDAAATDPDWLIVDEVGTLELDHNDGLEPTITHIINTYKNGSVSGKLMLVVRKKLLDEAVHRYGLNNDLIINKHFFT